MTSPYERLQKKALESDHSAGALRKHGHTNKSIQTVMSHTTKGGWIAESPNHYKPDVFIRDVDLNKWKQQRNLCYRVCGSRDGVAYLQSFGNV